MLSRSARVELLLVAALLIACDDAREHSSDASSAPAPLDSGSAGGGSRGAGRGGPAGGSAAIGRGGSTGGPADAGLTDAGLTDASLTDAGLTDAGLADAGGGEGGPGGGCPPLPDYPTPACTGWQHTGVTLTRYTGPSTISTEGTVLDSKSFTETLRITADDVTIKRSKMVFSGSSGFLVEGKNCLLEDVEISVPAQAIADSGRAINGTGFTARRVYVHDMPRGIAIGSTGSSSAPPVVIEDSYIDQLVATTSDHTTAIAAWGGANNVTIRHNTLGNAPAGGAPTGVLSAYQDFGPNGWSEPYWPNDNWKVTDNYFTGTTGEYVLTVGNSDDRPPNVRFEFGNNVFGTVYQPNGGHSGITASWSNHPTNYWWNNRWYTPGDPPQAGALVPGADTGAPP